MADTQTPALIVGAGPTGLMTACQLARFGIDFRIIDSKSGPTRESRALVVQARTMEVYQQLGIAKRAMDEGYVMPAMNIHVNGERRVRVPLGEIGEGLSSFPFLLVLEQSRNEQILLDRLIALGGKVEWSTPFVSLEQRSDGATATVQQQDDTEETINAQWIVAADGASSPIRHALNMPFGGGTYNERFYVADLDIEGDILHTEGGIYFAKEGFALILPLDGASHFRMVGIVPNSITAEAPSFDDIKTDLAPIFRKSLKFGEPNWFTSYTVHHRCVKSFRSGQVLLAGDAAHIHSPAGGQGMNTGLLDAHNLAWKLALVTQGQASETLIDTYNEERLPFAHRLLDTTDRGFRAAMSQDFWPVFLRTRIFPRFLRTAMKFSFSRRLFFETISQIGITHKGHSLAVNFGTERDRVTAGDRLPPFQIETEKQTLSTLDLLAEPGFQIIDFAAPRQAQTNATLCQKIEKQFGIPIGYAEAICLDASWRDDVEGRTFVMRPDMYIGMASKRLTEEQLLDYFTSTVGLTA